MEKQQREQVAKNMKDAKDKLESEMEDAYHEHQANLLRQGNWFWVLYHLFALNMSLNVWLSNGFMNKFMFPTANLRISGLKKSNW